MDRLIGTGVALVTPFNEQQRIDRESLYRLVNYVIDGGVDFLVALGTTAETATLSADEMSGGGTYDSRSQSGASSRDCPVSEGIIRRR